MTCREFTDAVRRMTAPWPTPVPDYIYQTIACNYASRKTAFFTAGEIRGKMILAGDEILTPPTRENTSMQLRQQETQHDRHHQRTDD
jgi:hypothetical protein